MQQDASKYSVLTHTLDPWDVVNIRNFFFLKEVMLLIKLMGMENRAPCKHIFCPYTPLTLLWGQTVNDVTSGVSAVTMFACRKYLLNGRKSYVEIFTF